MTTVRDIAAKIDPQAAQLALARIVASMGMVSDWDADTLDDIALAVKQATKGLDLPSWTDQDDDAIEFWESVKW